MSKKKHQKNIVEYGNLKEKVAVVWTRVSTKEQAENNNSLDVQKKECELYAQKHNIKIVKYYGGTNESAKTEGKLYREMITEVAKSKDVNIILVYSFDRFSRAGDEGILTKRYLKSKGIYVVSVTQPTDPDSAAGEFMENILFLFNQFENNLRKGKCEAGMKECIERGDWYSKPPMGFTKSKKEGKHIIEVNEIGEIIKEAFMWKAQEELPNTEIVKRLKAKGVKISPQKLSDIFHNPFYCGKIKHAYLDGKIIDGNQEILISEDIFNKVNGLNRDVDYSHADETPECPLKRHVYCSKCNGLMTGYPKKKKTGKIYYYYKCNTKGCKCNVGAETMHQQYIDHLSYYTIPADLIPILKPTLVKAFKERNESQGELHKELSKQLTECNNKINDINVKYGLGDINTEVYNATIGALKDKRTSIEVELEKAKENLSNLDKFIDNVLSTCSKLKTWWCNGTFQTRQKIQDLVFPEGISYDKEYGIYRTPIVNSVLSVFGEISEDYKKYINEKGLQNSNPFNLVAGTGLEPMTFGL